MPSLIEWSVTATCLFIIFVMSVLAWQRTWLAFSALKREYSALSEIESGNVPEIFDKVSDTTRTSAIYRTLHNAYTNGIWEGDSSLYIQKIQLSRYLAGIFVFVGLAGTVLGIGISLLSLGDVTTGSVGNTSGDLQKVMSSVGGVLAGMRSVAICTLGGILATILVSARNNIYLMEVDKFLARSETFWHHTLQPKYLQVEQDKQWKRQWSLLSGVLQEVSAEQNEVWKQAHIQLGETLNTAHIDLGRTLATAQANQGNQLKQGIEVMAAALFDPADALREAIREMKQEIFNTAMWLSNASQTAERVSTTLEATYRQQKESAQALTTASNTLQERMLGLETAFLEGMTRLQDSSERLNSITMTLLTSVESFQKAQQATIDTLKSDQDERSQEREVREIEINAMLREQERARQTWAAERAETIATLTTERNILVDKIQESLAALRETIAITRVETQQAATIMQNSILQESQTIRASFETTLAATQKSIDLMQKESQQNVKAMHTATQTVLTNAQEETKRAQETSERLHSIADKVLAHLEKAHSDQRTRIDTLVNGVRDTDKRLSELLIQFEDTLSTLLAQSEKNELRTALIETAQQLRQNTAGDRDAAQALRSALITIQAHEANYLKEKHSLAIAIGQLTDRLTPLPHSVTPFVLSPGKEEKSNDVIPSSSADRNLIGEN